ncbi:MAG: hypothetical protein QW630_03520 [Sulfolobales archaeon]
MKAHKVGTLSRSSLSTMLVRDEDPSRQGIQSRGMGLPKGVNSVREGWRL